MNIQQFGQTIKQKYPQYHDMSDEELGKKMLQKYPQYHDMISQQSPSVIQSGLGGMGRSLGGGAIQDILAPLFLAGQKLTHGQNPFAWGGGQPNTQQMNQYSQGNPFATKEQLQKMGGNLPQAAGQVGQDVAGAASWMVPESKVLKGAGIAAKAGNLAFQGATQGGLQSLSQPGATPSSVATGTVSGAVANPLLAGTGNLLTDKVPRYLGFRAYGKAGAKLPEVLKAQQEHGTEDLKGVRDYILENTKGKFNKGEAVQQVMNLASQSEWVGTKGLLDESSTITSGGGRRFVEKGIVSDIKNAAMKSKDGFEFYSRLKNMAYPTSDSPAANRLASFMRSAAHNVREQIINSTENPQTTRKAMDTYAAQMAIKAAKNSNNVNTVVRNVERYIPSGEAGLSVLGILSAIPGLHSVAVPLLLDAAISNKFVAPKLASGLIKSGKFASEKGLSSALRKLGVGTVVGMQAPQQ